MNVLLDWELGKGRDCRGGRVNAPSGDDVTRFLDALDGGSGSLTIEITGLPDVSMRSLQLLAEDGQHVLLLGQDDGTDYAMRTLDRRYRGRQSAIVGGNTFGSADVCVVFGIIRRAFDEFVRSGDVSREIFGPRSAR